MTTPEPGALALSIGMAVAAGLVGCFAVMRRMALAADALSHVALPGIGVALLLRLEPLLGALVMLLLGTLLIWVLERQTRLATETVVGVVFSTALAVGSLLTPGEELIDALLGGPGTLTVGEEVTALVTALAVVAFILTQRSRLLVTLVSEEMALASGIRAARLDLLFLLAFAVTIALGLRYLGVLLMGSLLIIPAATAKRLARDLHEMLAVSVGVAVLATVLGTTVAARLQQPTGPYIVAVAAACFFLSLLARPAR
jgi:zinc transport system permease protein